eukprot:m.250940 g.250940  ORF g.250940 m.250940 type:complete len:258 (-) comp15890_c0_seq1:115-888(-)
MASGQGAVGAEGFSTARRVFATAEDGALAWKLQNEEWTETKDGNETRSHTIRKDIKVAKREQMTEAELLEMHRQQQEAVAAADADVARRLSEMDEAEVAAQKEAAAARARNDAALAAEEEAKEAAAASEARERQKREDEALAKRLQDLEEANTKAERTRQSADLEKDLELAAQLQDAEKATSPQTVAERDAAIAARLAGGTPEEQEAELRRIEEQKAAAARDAALAKRMSGVDLDGRRRHDPTSTAEWEPESDEEVV